MLLLGFSLTEMCAQINHKHYVLIGKLELSKENYSEAIKNFNIAIIAKPNDFEAYFLRGIAKYSLSDYSVAISEIQAYSVIFKAVFVFRQKIHTKCRHNYHY